MIFRLFVYRILGRAAFLFDSAPARLSLGISSFVLILSAERNTELVVITMSYCMSRWPYIVAGVVHSTVIGYL